MHGQTSSGARSKEGVQSLSLEFFKTLQDKDWVFSKLKYPSALLFLRILSHICKEDWAWLLGGSRPGHLQGQGHPNPSAFQSTLQKRAPWQTPLGCTSSPIIILGTLLWALRMGRLCKLLWQGPLAPWFTLQQDIRESLLTTVVIFLNLGRKCCVSSLPNWTTAICFIAW